jgi:predicted ABC-type ATPase
MLPAEFLDALRSRSGPFLICLAGSNGAGKSTFFRRYLAATKYPFVNADEIARKLGGPVDDRLSRIAADLADETRRRHVERRESFVMETVFSDPVGEKVEFLANARAQGYCVILVFIGLASPELSRGRVLQRVRDDGGHDVPDDRIESRYPRTLANLKRALPRVDLALVLDNSAPANPYEFVALWRDGEPVRIIDPSPAWFGFGVG